MHGHYFARQGYQSSSPCNTVEIPDASDRRTARVCFNPTPNPTHTPTRPAPQPQTPDPQTPTPDPSPTILDPRTLCYKPQSHHDTKGATQLATAAPVAPTFLRAISNKGFIEKAISAMAIKVPMKGGLAAVLLQPIQQQWLSCVR